MFVFLFTTKVSIYYSTFYMLCTCTLYLYIFHQVPTLNLKIKKFSFVPWIYRIYKECIGFVRVLKKIKVPQNQVILLFGSFKNDCEQKKQFWFGSLARFIVRHFVFVLYRLYFTWRCIPIILDLENSWILVLLKV